MSPENSQLVLNTIERIEKTSKSQSDINEIWADVKDLFINELAHLPTLPAGGNKKERSLLRQSQPYWSEELASLWKEARTAEKCWIEFKVKCNEDIGRKNSLRENFKWKQKLFDSTFRRAKRAHRKQEMDRLEQDARNNVNSMWSTLKKLNDPPSSKASLEIIREDRTISRDVQEVLEKWYHDISKLYSGISNDTEVAFDDNFLEQVKAQKKILENLQPEAVDPRGDSDKLNRDLTLEEVSQAIDKSKLHKAYLAIPNEALKNNNAKLLLHKLFNLCFHAGLNPTDWNFSDIKPIPKKDKDAREPLQNRCISIICCVAKIYSQLLNERLQRYLEEGNFLAEEQNGFRSARSCTDHLFVLITILRNRKYMGKETFLTFIDFKKAFDSVNRDLLFFRLLQVGVVGRMYKAINSLYSNPQSRVILNQYGTDFFPCPIGVKQGDNLSPTLFAIYVNELAEEIKLSGIGVKLDDEILVNILLYADDIVILAENELDLQQLLYIVEVWCKNWRLEINLAKTHIMHVRGLHKKQSVFVFLFNKRPVEYCKAYKYLGATINEHVDFKHTVDHFSESASRALGCLVTKMIKNGGFPYKVYSILYQSCVASISDYGSEVFGYEYYQSKQNLHLRAIRAYLGVPKNSSHDAVLSEVDWLQPHLRSRLNMVRFFSRVRKMNDSRLTKIVFKWDKSLNDSGEVSTWCAELKTILRECNMEHVFDQCQSLPTKSLIKTLKTKCSFSKLNSFESTAWENLN